jgi:anoctamin-8
VALYFAWLGHYTCALLVPAVFGALLWAGLYGRGQVRNFRLCEILKLTRCLFWGCQIAQDIGHVIFSLFNVAWASLYLEAWRRYSVELAFRWGTLSTPLELLEPPRPLYSVSVPQVLSIHLTSSIIEFPFIFSSPLRSEGKSRGKFGDWKG